MIVCTKVSATNGLDFDKNIQKLKNKIEKIYRYKKNIQYKTTKKIPATDSSDLQP